MKDEQYETLMSMISLGISFVTDNIQSWVFFALALAWGSLGIYHMIKNRV